MPNNTQITDDVILQDAITKLSKLMEEDRIASVEKGKRDISIQKARAVIELYSNGKTFEEFISKNELFTQLSETNNESERLNISDFEYPKGTWKDKIIGILKYENRVLSVNEIIGIVELHQNDYTTKQLLGLISNTINTNLVKNGYLKIYKPTIPTKGFYYGNPLWWDGEELKKEHLPKPKQKKVW
jgi:hypothetical protein